MAITNTVYLVVPAKGGWAVNHGADTVSLHADHEAATRRAREMTHEAQGEGEAASIVDIECGATEIRPNKPL